MPREIMPNGFPARGLCLAIATTLALFTTGSVRAEGFEPFPARNVAQPVGPYAPQPGPDAFRPAEEFPPVRSVPRSVPHAGFPGAVRPANEFGVTTDSAMTISPGGIPANTTETTSPIGTVPRTFPGTAPTGPATQSIADTVPASRPAPNYYRDLFAPALDGQTVATPERTAAHQESHTTDAAENVVHAEYHQNDDGTAAEGGIVPVSGRSLYKPASQTRVEASPVSDSRMPTLNAGSAPVTTPDAVPATDPTGHIGGTGTQVPQGPLGPQQPNVSLTWVKQGHFNVGQQSHCDLVVKNEGNTVVANVLVQSYLPATVRVTAANPQPQTATNHLSWTFEFLKPQEERTIHLTVVPSERGPLPTFASVRFTGASSESFTVEEPLLEVSIDGPSEIRVGDPAPQTITITNPGTGVAENVRVEAVLPSGLEHPRGERLAMAIGSLNPGESRRMRLGMTAIQGGPQDVSVSVTADGNLNKTASATVTVAAPSLDVLVEGPGLRYKGRTADYRVTVTNSGQTTSNNVQAMHRLPEGFEFVQADRGGQFDAATGITRWFVGHLEPGQMVQMHVRLKAVGIGSQSHRVVAVSEQGIQSQSTIETRIDGSASLVLEIVDLDDPVEIGIQTAYEIRVSNEGTATATNVGLACELPAALQLLNAKGPTEGKVQNGSLVFESLPTLEPGKTAVFRVHVQGLRDGNHRFRTRLMSDSIGEPLIFEELTKFYKD